MGCLTRCKTLAWSFPIPNHLIRFASCAHSHTCSFEHAGDRSLGDTVLLSDFSLEHGASFVQSNNFGGRQICPFTHLIATKNPIVDKYNGFVYNIQVENDESYVVGNEHFVVHNCVHWYDIFRIGSPPASEEGMLSWLFE